MELAASRLTPVTLHTFLCLFLQVDSDGFGARMISSAQARQQPSRQRLTGDPGRRPRWCFLPTAVQECAIGNPAANLYPASILQSLE
jgi:hypothetical protein